MKPRALPLGAAVGVLLPTLIVLVLGLMGRLAVYLDESRAYLLLPIMIPLGFATAVLGWMLYRHLDGPRAGSAFSLGLLAGGSLAGTILLWASSPERPIGNRIVFSLFGGPLLAGFWLWIGGLLGYAARQQRSLADAKAT